MEEVDDSILPLPPTPESPLNLAGPTRVLAWTGDTDTVVEWPTYTVDELPFIEGYMPYPVDIYQQGGDKGWGLGGHVPTRGTFVPTRIVPAPQPSQHWDIDIQGFIPHTVEWNGICAGGVIVVEGVARRIYDGTLMGEWPINPPKEGKVVNPEKARLAALEDAA